MKIGAARKNGVILISFWFFWITMKCFIKIGFVDQIWWLNPPSDILEIYTPTQGILELRESQSKKNFSYMMTIWEECKRKHRKTSYNVRNFCNPSNTPPFISCSRLVNRYLKGWLYDYHKETYNLTVLMFQAVLIGKYKVCGRALWRIIITYTNLLCTT